MSETQQFPAYPEEEYSAYYKRQLYIAAMDDFAAFSGGIHKYADHAIRKLLIALKRGLLKELKMSWIESPDASSHPFHGRNLRNFIAGKDSAYAIWAVLDLYMKIEQPLIAKGFALEGYLERLGLVLADFVNVDTSRKEEPQIAGHFVAEPDDGITTRLEIEPLEGRRFAIAKLVKAIDAPDDDETVSAADSTVLRNQCELINEGVLIPQGRNSLLMIRNLETASVSYGFVEQSSGDELAVSQISQSGVVKDQEFTTVAGGIDA